MAKKTSKDTLTDADEALLVELGVEVEQKPVQSYTPKQERMIAGFEDIQRFYREHERLPQHGEHLDIFERLYAVRLDRIRENHECLELLQPFDEDGLLALIENSAIEPEVASDEELLGALGVDLTGDNSIASMKHVRTAAERQADRNSPEEVAQRKPCEEFEEFRLEFEAVQADIQTGQRITERFKFGKRTKIAKGDWFILDGQKAFVAEVDKWFTHGHGKRDRRLRVIFDNGTESDLLLLSLQRALQKDENGRRIVLPQSDYDDSELGPLFSDQTEEGDTASGTIYIARSLSTDEFIRENRDVIHKIGATNGDPQSRVSGAKKDPTFLLAEAELVATYNLANINSKAFEKKTLHKFFAKARLDVALADRFGDKVRPQEWFLVPLPVIDEAVERIKDGTIENYRYDPETAKLQVRK